MLCNVMIYHHWTPKVVSNLFLDNFDEKGLLFWQKIIEKENKALKAASKRKR